MGLKCLGIHIEQPGQRAGSERQSIAGIVGDKPREMWQALGWDVGSHEVCKDDPQAAREETRYLDGPAGLTPRPSKIPQGAGVRVCGCAGAGAVLVSCYAN